MAFLPIALGAASIATSLFSRNKRPKGLPAIDISGELAKLDELYGKQRQYLTEDIRQQTAALQSQTAQSLANRGILSSPISERSFIEARARGQQALGRGLADLYGSQATARSAALNNLMAYNQRVNEANAEMEWKRYMANQQARQGLLSGGLSSLAYGFGGAKPAAVNPQQPYDVIDYMNRRAV